jgi:6-phosphogluconate dehydrogenase
MAIGVVLGKTHVEGLPAHMGRWPEQQSMSSYLVDRVMDAENVELLTNIEVRELMGEVHLEEIVVGDNRSGARRILGAQALFVFISADVNTDIIVDGANSYFRDSIVRAQRVRNSGLRWLDAGVSGGIWGYDVGYTSR